MTAATPQSRDTVPPGYKQTEVGVIPEDWEVKPLGNVAALQRGFDLPHRLRQQGAFPVITSSGIGATHCEARVRGPGVVIGRYGTIGEVFYEPSDFWPLNTTLYVKDFHGNVPRFIFYFLRTINYQEHSGKTGVPGVNRNDLHQISIAFPLTLAEQDAIATALSDADAWIESLEKLIAKKRAIKQGTMQALLTPPGQPGHQRLPGFEGEWKVKRLGEIGTFLKGAGVRKDEAISGSLPCVRYGEIYTHHLDCITQFFSWISRDVALTSVRLHRGDILFAGSGETREEIGKCVAFVRNEEAYAGGDIVILRPEADIADSFFLGYYLNAHHINLQKSSRGQGDAVVHIGAKALGAIEATLPSVDEQSAIAAVFSDMDEDIAALEAKLGKARRIKQGMMQELLTGRIRLV